MMFYHTLEIIFSGQLQCLDIRSKMSLSYGNYHMSSIEQYYQFVLPLIWLILSLFMK